MKKNMKLAMAALLLPLSLTAIASAQEAPVLIGNYSANIEGAVNPMGSQAGDNVHLDTILRLRSADKGQDSGRQLLRECADG